MLKKILSTALAAAMLGSIAVIPAHAATFSSANKTRYYNGISNGGSGNFNYTIEETKVLDGNAANAFNTSDGKYITKYKGVGSASTTLTSNRNVISYKTKSATRGTAPQYVHFQIYLGVYEDSGRTGLDDFNIMRHTKEDGSGEKLGSLRSNYLNNNTVGRAYPNGDGDLIVENYDKDFWSLRSSKDEQTYHKLDFVVDANALSSQANITYLFVDNRYIGSNYTSTNGGFDNFYGYSFRILSGKSINTNTTVEAYFADGFEGHTEYNDTEDYKVCLEDVLQDIGMGDAIDSTMIYKTSKLDWYLPSTVNAREMYYTKNGTKSSRVINTPNGTSKSTVTYSGQTATVSHTQSDASEWEEAADVLAFQPYSIDNARHTGVSYKSYHPRAKYVKLSFDQTITSGDGTWLGYDLYAKDTGVEGLQMWNNGGNLVVGIKGGGGNNTLNGSGKKPVALINGTNHIDWIMEFVENETNTSEGGIKQYVYVNNKYVGEGKIGTNTFTRLNNIRLFTKGDSNPEITIDNWSMTLYNETANLSAIAASITNENIIWGSGNYEMGYEKKGNKIAVLVTASNNAGVTPSASTKVITAIYDINGRLIDAISNAYVSGQTLADETVTNTFDYSSDMKTIKAFVWDYVDGSITPQVDAYEMTIE